jgi:16S rRNA (cytidine1402-2'-O)-methyltransferase
VACDLTLPTQTIVSHPVKDWPKDAPDLHKRPAIFIVHAA